jgi:Ca2+-transporting ATPase
MEQPPREKGEPLFSRAFSLRLAWQGALVAGVTLAAYGLGLTEGGAAANTMAFSALTFSQLFHAFDVRSEKGSLFRLGLFSNPAMNKAFLAGTALQLAVLLLPPLQGAFGVVSLTLAQWGEVLGLALTPLVVCEGVKASRRVAASRPGRVTDGHRVLSR